MSTRSGSRAATDGPGAAAMTAAVAEPPVRDVPAIEAPAGGVLSRLDELIVAAVGGDPGAEHALLAEIHPLVLRYCRSRLGRRDSVSASAEDVAQEVCLGVVHALPTYRLRGLSFRAFVYGIAAHKVADVFRAIARNRTEPVAEIPDRAVPDDGPEQQVLAGELSGRVARLLEVLTPRQREVLVLRVAVGLSAEETACTVGSTPGAVRVTQHRALVRLRRAIGGPDTGAVEGDGIGAGSEE